jgi:hypothetical protein
MRFALWLVLLLSCASRAATTAQVPYRAFRAVLDGDGGEWRPPYLERQFAESALDDDRGNRARVRAVWDLDALWFAIDVDDAELIAAPAGLSVDQFHQYDSLQIYLDPLGDSAAAMDRNDVDILLLPDGRAGVLRGDDLVTALTGARGA